MAITVIDNRDTSGLIDHADSTTGWTSPVAGESVSLFTSAPDPKEASGHVGVQVSNSEVELLHTHTSTNLSSGVLVYIWVLPQGIMDTTANYGVAAVLGDGTDTNAYQIGGSDQAVFRHDSGSNTSYQCICIDTASLPGTGKALRGTFGSLTLTAITEFGADFTTTVKSVGGVENCFIDTIRYGNGGLTITGTDTGVYFLNDLSVLDAASTTGGSYGICRDLGGEVYGVQGQILLGDTTTGNDTLRMIGQTLKFENFSGVSTDKFGVTIQGGTGTNNITFTDATLFCPVGTGAFLTATDTDLESFDMTGCLIQNFDQGINFSQDATNGPNHDISGNTFFGCSQINSGETAFVNNTINSTTDANGGWIIDSSTDLTNVDSLKFISDGTGHAIYITATGTYSFTDFTYDSYGTTTSTDAVIYNNSGGNVTINVSGGDTPTYRNGAGATTTVNNTVETKINIRDNQGNFEEFVRIYMAAADGNGDLPFEESVTIVRVAATATVTHTTHGLNTGEYIKLAGITNDVDDNSGAFQITVTDANTYTYTSNNSGNLTYTGTIIATGATIYGETDVNGDISSSRTYGGNQELTGYARKSSDGTTYFKSIELIDTVNSSTGLIINRRLVSDGLVNP